MKSGRVHECAERHHRDDAVETNHRQEDGGGRERYEDDWLAYLIDVPATLGRRSRRSRFGAWPFGAYFAAPTRVRFGGLKRAQSFEDVRALLTPRRLFNASMLGWPSRSLMSVSAAAPTNPQFHVKMAFVWTLGGFPLGNLEWVGGQITQFVPDQIVTFEDLDVRDADDLKGISHCLEPMNKDSERVLAYLDALLERPADVSMPSEWSPERWAFVQRSREEREIRNGNPPKLRTRGRPRQETTGFALAVKLRYEIVERAAKEEYEADSRKSRHYAAIASGHVTKTFGISRRTVQRILHTFRGRTRRRSGIMAQEL